jgi:hypothetical protein
VEANPDKPWDYDWMSQNPNISWEIVEANPDKPWDYRRFSNNKMWKHEFFAKQLTYVLK